MAVDAPTSEETTPQKRTTLDSIESDDDEPAVKYWRSDDFVWTSWSVHCLEAAGAPDEQAEVEATQKAPDSLLSQRYEACRREQL